VRAGSIAGLIACGGMIATLAVGMAGAQGADPDASRRTLASARADAAAAARRASALAAAAARETGAAARAAAQERALAGRVNAAQADLAATRARAALVTTLVAQQRERLARAQEPVARLLAALQSMARRPAIVAIAQPGSVDDMVHLRAVLGSTLPAVQARTAGLRQEIAATRKLAAVAAGTADALRRGRATLEAERTRLALLEARHRAQASALGRGAASEQDRALALGERARDLVDRLEEDGAAKATAAALAPLPDPIPRPLAPGVVLAMAGEHGAYRLPVAGQLVTGLSEVSGNGIRSRGLTLSVRPGASVVAPAGGVVRFARPFRHYGTIIIIDHGSAWSTLVTGLSAAAVNAGERVAAGAVLGAAAVGEDPRVTVELRRRGRPVDITALLG
jgi:septal ring factor EnvC (AmiA/AmiB activator)